MHVYFSGIGGAGIGPLALLAKDCGYSVSGSDITSSPFTQKFNQSSDSIHIGTQDGSFLSSVHQQTTINWLVYSAAVPQDNLELVTAQKLGIRTSKRDEFINHILTDKKLKLIAISGTHGKTTTTAMLIWLFHKLNIPVSYQVGTNLPWGPSAHHDIRAKYFIYEADEYDRNMLQFKPYLAIIPSLDYDHPDVYPTEDNYLQAFQDFSAQSESLVTWAKIAKKLRNTVAINDNEDVSGFKLAGEQNRQNAKLVLEAARSIVPELNEQDVIKILSDFPGTQRRFEKLAENLYSDYAHHPSEVKATVGAALELSKKVVVVYQPHQDRRQREVADLYKLAFLGVKQIYWLPTYNPKGRDNQKALKPQQLIARLTNQDIALPAQLNDELESSIAAHLANGDLVLACSAGNLDEWLRQNFKP